MLSVSCEIAPQYLRPTGQRLLFLFPRAQREVLGRWTGSPDPVRWTSIELIRFLVVLCPADPADGQGPAARPKKVTNIWRGSVHQITSDGVQVRTDPPGKPLVVSFGFTRRLQEAGGLLHNQCEQMGTPTHIYVDVYRCVVLFPWTPCPRWFSIVFRTSLVLCQLLERAAGSEEAGGEAARPGSGGVGRPVVFVLQKRANRG